MSIWKQDFTLEGLRTISTNTLVDYFDINFVEYGDNYLVATMPVNERTVQPMRILHGGASVALAETVGSLASMLCLNDLTQEQAVGLSINANHLRSVPEGEQVRALCTAIHIGRTTHVWQITISDATEETVCVCRLTMMVRKSRG